MTTKGFKQVNDIAISLWLSACKSKGSQKVNLIKSAEIEIYGYIQNINLDANDLYYLIDSLKKEYKNPLVASVLNKLQNGLRHTIKIQNM